MSIRTTNTTRGIAGGLGRRGGSGNVVTVSRLTQTQPATRSESDAEIEFSLTAAYTVELKQVAEDGPEIVALPREHFKPQSRIFALEFSRPADLGRLLSHHRY
jgi:hypothetical protein